MSKREDLQAEWYLENSWAYVVVDRFLGSIERYEWLWVYGARSFSTQHIYQTKLSDNRSFIWPTKLDYYPNKI